MAYLVVFTIGLALLFDFLNGMIDEQKTMGVNLTHLKPIGGFCAETAGDDELRCHRSPLP